MFTRHFSKLTRVEPGLVVFTRQTNPGRTRVSSVYTTETNPGRTRVSLYRVNRAYVKPLVRRSPENVILHVGTNDLRSCPPRNIADSILNLVTQVKQDSPTTSVGVSGLIVRTDNDVLARKARQVNSILRDYCEHNKIAFINNSNITAEHLNHKGLHLNRQGSVALQENFRKFVNTISH